MLQESARDERRMFETYDVCVCFDGIQDCNTIQYIIIYNVISYNMNLIEFIYIYVIYYYTVIVMICFAYLIMQYN